MNADRLVWEALEALKAAEPDEYTPHQFYDWLLVKDDELYGNSDLSDGTPHSNEIWQAFADRNMRYNALPTASLASPVNGDSTIDDTPPFSWVSEDLDLSLLTNTLYIGTGFDPFASPILTKNVGTGNSYTLAESEKLSPGTYTWGVKVSDLTKTIESEIRTLYVNTPPPWVLIDDFNTDNGRVTNAGDPWGQWTYKEYGGDYGDIYIESTADKYEGTWAGRAYIPQHPYSVYATIELNQNFDFSADGYFELHAKKSDGATTIRIEVRSHTENPDLQAIGRQAREIPYSSYGLIRYPKNQFTEIGGTLDWSDIDMIKISIYPSTDEGPTLTAYFDNFKFSPDILGPEIYSVTESADPICLTGTGTPDQTTISATVDDTYRGGSNIAFATLNYKLPGESLWTAEFMYPQDGAYDEMEEVAERTIGPISVSGVVYYYVAAEDTAGNVETGDIFTLTVEDCTPPNTPTGTNVNTDLGTGASTTFSDVTTAGETTDSVFVSNPVGSLPSGFKSVGDFHDITTTAVYVQSNNIVSLSYSEAEVTNENNLRIFHWTGSSWEDSTTSVDTVGNKVQGIVSTLSPFVVVEETTITVCSSGCDYTSIQAAVDAAGNGYTVQVGAGTYTENVNVGKSVNIVGAGYADTIVNAASSSGHVFEVTAGNVKITGFTIIGATGAGKAGIYLYGATSGDISANVVSGNSYGMYIWSSGGTTVTGNKVESGTRHGVTIRTSDNSVVRENIVKTQSDTGIYLHSTNNANIENNTATSNTVAGIYAYNSSSNTIQDNTLKSNGYGIVLDTSTGNTIFNNIASLNTNNGIKLSSSTGNTISNNGANSNTYGINLVSSNGNTISSNTVNSNSDIGIYLRSTNNANVQNNALTSNTVAGIYMYGSSTNAISSNTLNSNGHGIALDAATGNTISSNTVNSNTYNGINLDSSSTGNTLTNNVASNNYGGTYITSSGSNTLQGNTMSGNTVNFYVWGGPISDFTQTIDTTNIVDGKPIYYLVGVSDTVIDSSTNAGYVAVINGNNVVVRDLTLKNNGQGVLFVNSAGSILSVNASNNLDGIYTSGTVTIRNCRANSNTRYGIVVRASDGSSVVHNAPNSNGGTGIYLYNANNANIENNTAIANAVAGIYMENSGTNTISGNTLNSNGYGISLSTSTDNIITNNIASGNTNYGIYLSSSDNNLISVVRKVIFAS